MPVTEVLLTATAKKLFDLALGAGATRGVAKLTNRLRGDREARAFELAFARAYRTFARAHSGCVAEMFDEHLLKGPAAPLLAGCLLGQPPEPDRLAEEWITSIGLKPGPRRDQRKAEILHPAADFVRWLTAEMRMLDEFRPVFDSRRLDEMTHALERPADDLAALLTETLAQIREYDARASEAATLDDLVLPPQEVFERVRLDRYVGRRWLEEDLDDFLATRERGTWLLISDAGIGKTAFLAHLVQRRNYVSIFSEQAPGETNLDRALENLAAQIVRRYQLDPYLSREALPAALRGRPDFLRKLIWLASDRLGAGEKLVIVADSLDEAGIAAGGNVLGLPTHLPLGVFLVLSTRPVSLPLRLDPPPREVRLRAEATENREDMGAFLARAASSGTLQAVLASQDIPAHAFVSSFLERSDGNWMYLHYVLDDIESGHRQSLDLQALPAGLAGYFAEYWRRWRDSPRWNSEYAPLLATLAASLEPLSVDQLTRWSGVDYDSFALKRLLRDEWGPFIHELDDGGSPRFRPYHATLRDFLRGSAPRTFPEGSLADELRERTRYAHGRIADALHKEADEGAPTEYCQRHRSAHLRLAGRTAELFALLDDPVWTEAQVSADNVGSQRVRDMAEGMRSAAEIDIAAVRTASPARLASRHLRYALETAELRTAADQLPPWLLSAAVATDYWRYEDALNAIAQQTSDRRARSLKALAPLLRPAAVGARETALLGRALAAARDMPISEGRALALLALAHCLSADDQADVARESLTIARSLPSQAKARVVADAAALRAVPLDAALDVAVTIADHVLRAQALRGLAEVMSGEQRRTVFSAALDAARNVPDGEGRARALTALLRLASDDAEVRSIGEEALPTIRSLTSLYAQATALGSLAEMLPDVHLTVALDIASTMPLGEPRARALTSLAARLTDSQRRTTALQVLRCVESIPTAWGRAQTLMGVVPVLTGSERAAVLEALPSACRDVSERAVTARLLGELSQLCSGERRREFADEAVDVASAISDPRSRSRISFDLSTRLSGEAGSRALTHSIAAARSVPDESQRARLLFDLAKVLSGEVRRAVLSDALAAAGSMSAGESRAELLTLLADGEGHDSLRTMIEQMLVGPVRASEAPSYVPATVAMLACLPADAAPELASTVLRELDGLDLRFDLRAFGVVVDRVPEEDLSIALELATSLRGPPLIEALRVVARRLAGLQGDDAAMQAITATAEALHGAWLRNVPETVAALTGIFPVERADVLLDRALKIPKDRLRGLAVVAVVGAIPGHSRSDALVHRATAALTDQEPDQRAAALLHLTAITSGGQRAVAVAELRATAAALEPMQRVTILTELTQFVGDDTLDEVILEALAAAEALAPEVASSALLRLALQLPRDRRRAVARDALRRDPELERIAEVTATDEDALVTGLYAWDLDDPITGHAFRNSKGVLVEDRRRYEGVYLGRLAAGYEDSYIDQALSRLIFEHSSDRPPTASNFMDNADVPDVSATPMSASPPVAPDTCEPTRPTPPSPLIACERWYGDLEVAAGEGLTAVLRQIEEGAYCVYAAGGVQAVKDCLHALWSHRARVSVV